MLGADGNAWCSGCTSHTRQCPEHDLPYLVTPQSAEQIVELCRGLDSGHANSMEAPTKSHDPPPRPLARHLSDADRLRKVIQELVDTEKSYVKVTGIGGHSHPFDDGDVEPADTRDCLCLGHRPLRT